MDRLAPHRTDTWAHGAKPAQKQYAAIARPSPSSRRSLCAPTRTTTPTAKAVFEDDENVTVIEMTTDDAWVPRHRRHLRHRRQGRQARLRLALQRLRRLPSTACTSRWKADDQIACKMAELSHCRRYRPDDMILEGGSITVDGEGTSWSPSSACFPRRTASAVLAEEGEEDTIWPSLRQAPEP